MSQTQNLHSYDSGWDTAESKDSLWNRLIEIENNVKYAKMFFNNFPPHQTPIEYLKKARHLIDKAIEKHENC